MKLLEMSKSKNTEFSQEILKLYIENPDEAKAYYYKEKLKIDVKEEQGAKAREQILVDYLHGLQWVMYYYYKGVQHWGFYYPYHFPPMISDIKDVHKLVPEKITNFDYFKAENKVFQPYQQLLTILPKASIKRLLPKDYYQFVEDPEFKDYFPDHFEQDLNGKTTPWEAIVLIPFVDE